MDTKILIADLATERLGVSSEALRKWRFRGHVPHKWRIPLIEAAQAAGRYISPSSFDDFGNIS
jgi:hypothetical protein